MAVRFLPPPEERPRAQREEQGDLAEVIEFRSRLRRPEPAAPDEAPRRGEAVADPLARGAATVDRLARGSRQQGEPRGAGGARPAAALRALLGPASEAVADGSGVLASGTHASGVHASGLSATTPDAEQAECSGPTPYESAVKLLARRALSSGELQRALVSLGHPEVDAEQAVAECVDALYLDDADLAVTVAEKLRSSKGESKARIRQKLRERQLPDVAIEAALEGLDDDDELELLTQTARERARRLTGLDRQTAERRLLGFLARRGWSGERATRAAREALDGGTRPPGRGTVRFQ